MKKGERIAYASKSLSERLIGVDERKIKHFDEADPNYYPVLELLSQRYTVKILRITGERPLRLCQLVRDLRMNPNTLKSRIQELEASKLIVRFSEPETPTVVLYALTQRGFELVEAFDELLKLVDSQAVGDQVLTQQTNEISDD